MRFLTALYTTHQLNLARPFAHIVLMCTHQGDIIERASQVKGMRDIYTKAWTPLVWLGEHQEKSEDALDLITTLATEYSSADGVSKLTSVLGRDPEHFGKGVWRALYEIALRRYWR